MSDCVTREQQRTEEEAAMTSERNCSPTSEEQLRTQQWIEDLRAGQDPSPSMQDMWPNANVTLVPTMIPGCSRAPDDAASSSSQDSKAVSKDTDAILESMTYVGGMSYAQYRLEEASKAKAKASGKQKKAPMLTVYMRGVLCGEDAVSTRDGATSVASSRRSSAYRAAVMLEAEARLADTRTECAEQHEIEAVQRAVKEGLGLRSTGQQQTVHDARLDAMGYRLEKMKKVLLRRKLRMEEQMTELYAQMNVLSAATREAAEPGTSAPAGVKVAPAKVPVPVPYIWRPVQRRLRSPGRQPR